MAEDVGVGYKKRLGASMTYSDEVPLMGLCLNLYCWTQVTGAR